MPLSQACQSLRWRGLMLSGDSLTAILGHSGQCLSHLPWLSCQEWSMQSQCMLHLRTALWPKV